MECETALIVELTTYKCFFVNPPPPPPPPPPLATMIAREVEERERGRERGHAEVHPALLQSTTVHDTNAMARGSPSIFFPFFFFFFGFFFFIFLLGSFAVLVFSWASLFKLWSVKGDGRTIMILL